MMNTTKRLGLCAGLCLGMLTGTMSSTAHALGPAVVGQSIGMLSHILLRLQPGFELRDEAADVGGVTHACPAPAPSSRWKGRESDDEWIPGLYPSRDRFASNKVAITFDDGPNPNRTPNILAELEARELHATFFLTGHAIRPESYHLVRQMVDDGHLLANHGWRHDVHLARRGDLADLEELSDYVESEFELTQIRLDFAMLADSPEQFTEMDDRVFDGLRRRHSRQRQLAAMPGIRARHAELLAEHGYSEATRPYPMTFARPPGGAPYMGGRYFNGEREAFAEGVNRLGLELVMWNGGSGDSNPRIPPSERMDPARVSNTVATVLDYARDHSSIYVAHDRIRSRALRSMLDRFARGEIEVVGLGEMRDDKANALGWCG